jgi:hypothetical protein
MLAERHSEAVNYGAGQSAGPFSTVVAGSEVGHVAI